MMTLKLRVHGGRLRLDEATDLPEGSEVELVPVIDDDLDAASRAALEAALRGLADEIARGELVSADSVLKKLP